MELDERTDVWSLGTLLYFIYFQEFAFDSSKGILEIVVEIINDDIKSIGSAHLAAVNGITSFPRDITAPLQKLIVDMVCLNASERPFVPEIIERCKQLLGCE